MIILEQGSKGINSIISLNDKILKHLKQVKSIKEYHILIIILETCIEFIRSNHSNLICPVTVLPQLLLFHSFTYGSFKDAVIDVWSSGQSS
jgi:hypothetical protein